MFFHFMDFHSILVSLQLRFASFVLCIFATRRTSSSRQTQPSRWVTFRLSHPKKK